MTTRDEALRDALERFLHTSAPHDRERERRKLIHALLSASDGKQNEQAISLGVSANGANACMPAAPVAWIVSRMDGEQVLHFSSLGGWQVDVVATQGGYVSTGASP